MNAPVPPRTLTVECAGTTYTITPDRAPASVGRSAAADVPVADPRASRTHVRLELDRGAWRAVDADSRNGMFVDGQRHAVVRIHDGLVINVGNPDGMAVTFRFANDGPYLPPAEDDHVDSAIVRAGAAVAARRRELDITQRTLAKYRIMNAGALIAFEKGRSWPRERTRAKLEEVLQWPPGSIANIRNGGAIPGERPEADPSSETTPLIVGAVDVAMKTFAAAIDTLPDVSAPDFTRRAAVILADLRELEAVVARAARQSRGMPAVVMALSAVRTRYETLMLRAAAAPNATLGQRLFAARRRANLTAPELANAVGLSAQLIEAVEAGHSVADADAAAIGAFLAQLEPSSGDIGGDESTGEIR
jgi:transcriptional regulator with XRE-family HTH domain